MNSHQAWVGMPKEETVQALLIAISSETKGAPSMA
jgi:hypothetical protein